MSLSGDNQNMDLDQLMLENYTQNLLFGITDQSIYNQNLNLGSTTSNIYNQSVNLDSTAATTLNREHVSISVPNLEVAQRKIL